MLKILFYLSVLLLYSCEEKNDYIYHDNPPLIQEEAQTRKILKDDLSVDILFVVDNSGSMYSIQNNIIKNAAVFMENFLQDTVMDWRIAVVSTDSYDSPYLGFNPIFDKLVDNPVSTFQQAIRSLGTNGSASEYIFYNTLRFMSDTSHGYFFRENAHLAVIMVTDEKEQSEDYGSQYEPLTFLNTIKSLKSDDRIVRFYGALNMDDLEGCNGWSDYTGSPFETVITQTGGIIMSACTSDFGVNLASIGNDIVKFGESPRFTLDTRPKIETIRIYYRDTLLPMGKQEDGGVWYYDKYYNTINFYNIDWAQEGYEDEDIQITYDIDDGVQRF